MEFNEMVRFAFWNVQNQKIEEKKLCQISGAPKLISKAEIQNNLWNIRMPGIFHSGANDEPLSKIKCLFHRRIFVYDIRFVRIKLKFVRDLRMRPFWTLHSLHAIWNFGFHMLKIDNERKTFRFHNFERLLYFVFFLSLGRMAGHFK